MLRSLLLASLLVVQCVDSQAEGSNPLQDLRSIGMGPFEVPIAGRFRAMREGGATVFTSEDETRRITAGFLQSARHSGPEQIDQVAGILQRSWERFAQQEKMRVTAPFRRIALGNGLVIFTQSAEMHAAGQLQHYINYAVTDGPRVGTLIFEGFGKASEASKDIEPQVLGVRLVLRSN